MMHRRRIATAAATTALAALVAGQPQPASAQYLFDMLFGNQPRRVYREVEPQPVLPAPVRREAPRISGPQYYTYKTDPLVRVDFAAITPSTEDADQASIREEDHTRLEPPARRDVLLAQAVIGETASDVDPTADILSDALEEDAAEAEPTVAAEEADTAAEAGPAPAAREADLPNALVEAEEGAPGLEPSPDVEPANGAEVAEEAGSRRRMVLPPPVPSVAQPTREPSVAVERAVPPAVPAPEEAELPSVAEPARPDRLDEDRLASLQDFELMAEAEAAEAIVAHYTGTPEMLWTADGKPNAQARRALDVLGDAASHGLDPRDYQVSVPAAGDAAAATRFEMELSARLLRYVRDARNGRIDPNRISGYHDFEPKPLDMAAMLKRLGNSEDVGALLEEQHPANEHYKALRVELELLRASQENEVVVADDTLVRPGESDPEFSKILTIVEEKADAAFRAEHGAVLARHLGSEVYAQELVPVIKAAQRAAGVGDDGVIGPRTIHAIAGDSKADRIRKVEVALEQIRWLPSELPERHVFINTPAFEATYVEDGREALSMRTVVGNTGTQTYFFQDEIEYVEFHPYWGVPKSILVNKYLPKLYGDPSYLDRNGFEVVNSRGQVVSSSSVNWGQYGANVPFDVRQRPGASNALGELKIMFPNRHAIYMHDTPERHLFDRENRALSNGCIRLADPRGMAAAVLGWDRPRLDARLEQPHSRENLDQKVAVYVTYFTAWPTEAGAVEYFPDVYGRDDKTAEAISRMAAVRAPGA